MELNKGDDGERRDGSCTFSDLSPPLGCAYQAFNRWVDLRDRGSVTQLRDYGYNAGHAIKRIILILGLPVLTIWSMFSVYRLIAFGVMMLLFMAGPYYIHRHLTRRVFACDGFRLVAFFSAQSAFVSGSFDWPWWSECYCYCGVVESESGEPFDCDFSVQGPFFAVICPSVRSVVHAFGIEADDGKDVRREDIVRRLQNLRTVQHLNLDLSQSRMTDVELVHIENWENLEFVSLAHTEVTDQGLQYLKGLANLKGLDLYKTETTHEGRNILRRLLPECAIFPEP